MDLQVNLLPSPQIDWEGLNLTRKEVKRFFKSLGHENIKPSVSMAFKKNLFVLEPRRSGLRKQSGGRFTAIQSGFIQLDQKIESLTKSIESFNPVNCPRTALTFFYGLRKIQAIVESSSQFGLIVLCGNYTGEGKHDKAGSLQKLGESSFLKLNQTIQLLRKKITPYFKEDLEIDTELHKLQLPVASHMRKTGDCRLDLDRVNWGPDEGVQAPRELIREWYRDAKLQTKYPTIATGAAYQNAANLIKVSQGAQPMLVQNGTTSWVPLRPSLRNNEIVLVEEKDGVTGTYERTLGVQDLCNVYFRTTDGCISTSAIDTPLKASQISVVINYLLGTIPHPNGRWILHQLNSFFTETKLIENVHSQISSIEEKLKLKQPNITFLHVNTPFNAATNVPFENSKSVTKINIDSLTQLAQFVMVDIDSLLGLSEKGLPAWIEFQKNIADLLKLVLKIKEQKSKTGKSISSLHASSSTNLSKEGSSSEESVMLPESSLLDVGELAPADEETFPEDQEPLTDLSTLQSELKAALRTCFKKIEMLRSDLRTEDVFYELAAEEAHLILEVFQTILALQLDIKGKPALSRCSEVELFLLLDRLLNIKRIISCYSGLDRTNTVVAMDDSMECLLKTFKQFHLQQLPNNEYRERIARTKALRNLFQLISNMDENRAKLIKLGNESLKEIPVNSVITIIDKKEVETFEGGANLRQIIIQKIDQLHTLANQTLDHSFDPDILKHTLFYLELMTKHLLTTQIKTFSSTGLFGYCWHWESLLAANPHPKERLTQFISVEGLNVQLTYRYSYLFDSVTTAAIQIFSRLSFMRGV